MVIAISLIVGSCGGASPGLGAARGPSPDDGSESERSVHRVASSIPFEPAETAPSSSGSIPGLTLDDRFEAVLSQYWTLLHRARREPWTHDPRALDAVVTGAGRERFLRQIDQLGGAEEIRVGVDSRFEVRLARVRAGPIVAVGEECVLDDLARVVVRNPHTGERYQPPLLVDDGTFTHRYGVTFQLADTGWKIADRVLIETRGGGVGCASGW